MDTKLMQNVSPATETRSALHRGWGTERGTGPRVGGGAGTPAPSAHSGLLASALLLVPSLPQTELPPCLQLALPLLCVWKVLPIQRP